MLPKIKHPTFEIKIPSTGKKELFRQFLVREEKVLLMAKSSEDPADVFRSVKQVVNNCAISDKFDADKLTMFDLEYLFLKLRALSVSNIVKVTYRDNEDQKTYDFAIDLDKVEVLFPEGVEKTVKINDRIGLVMKYASASLLDDNEFLNSGDDSYYELIIRCVDKIYDGETVYEASDVPKEELESFLDDLDVKVFEKIQQFMSATPKLYHKIEYKNENGNDRVIELSTLTDFFTLG